MLTRRSALAALTAAVAAPAFLRAADRPPRPAVAAPPEPPANTQPTVKVASIQCSSDLGDVAGNRKKLTALCEKAVGNGAKIIVLPEAAITGYLSQDLKTNWQLPGWPLDKAFPNGKDPQAFAEAVPGPSTDHFAALAKKLGVYITVPLVEVDTLIGPGPAKRTPIPKYYNTVCLVSPEGKLVAHYRKLTPWPHPEQSWATAGDRGVQTFDTEYGRVGLGICFDIHTILEKYQPHHIWALLYPIAWVDDEHPAEWFYHVLPARIAKFNHYVVGANWSVDQKQTWRGYGFSTIFASNGEVLASAKSLYGSEIIYADLKTAK